jgi:hypothetical protein
LLSRGHQESLGTLKVPNTNSYTNNTYETLNVLANTHFPDHTTNLDNPSNDSTGLTRMNLLKSKTIFNKQRITWAIQDFKPLKAAGMDGIFPALLQEGLEYIINALENIFSKSHSLGYIPMCWREVKVIFIPKAGKRSMDDAKSFRPIVYQVSYLKHKKRF